MTEGLRRLLRQNESTVQLNIESVLYFENEYRELVVQEYYYKKIYSMQYEFMTEVYNKDYLARADLDRYFDSEITDPMHSLMDNCNREIDGLFEAMQFVKQSEK